MWVRWGYRRVPFSVSDVSQDRLGISRTGLPSSSSLCPSCCSATTAGRTRSSKSHQVSLLACQSCQNFDINWLFKTLLLRSQTSPVCPLNFSFWTFYLASPHWPQPQAWIFCSGHHCWLSALTLRVKYSTLEKEPPPPVTGAKCQSSICSAETKL